MNTAALSLLSLTSPGDLIRFVYEVGPARRLEFSIEGAPAGEGDGRLADRLAMALGALREEGFDFRDRVGKSPGRARRPATTRAASGHVFEIRPLSLPSGGAPEGVFGFSGGKRHEVALPAFHALCDRRVFRSPAEAILLTDGLRRLEVEFTRFDAPADVVEPLEGVLALHSLHAGLLPNQPSAHRAFVALWLLHRSGWRVGLRAWASAKLRPAALELLGRDLFLSDCEVVGEETPAPPASALDLSDCFPRGWQFPELFPVAESHRQIAAMRLHNRRIPELPRQGFVIGLADGRKVRLPEDARERHSYIVGATGTGKSTLLGRMIREDIRAGRGVILLDPHGDLHAEVLASVPPERQGDLLVIDPTREDCRPGLNIFDIPQGDLRKRHAELLVGELVHCFRSMWDNPEAFGPMFEAYFRNAIQLLTLRDGEPLTVDSFNRVFTDREFRAGLLKECTDAATASFWTDVAEKAGGESSLANLTPYITSKMGPLTQGAFLSCLLRQARDEVRLVERINRNPIILINLNKGTLGLHESRILGVILMAQIMSAGLQRSLQEPHLRTPVNVYVDEFQNFVSDNVASMLSEARKFGLRLHMANQNIGQLRANRGMQSMIETVLGNVGTMILFRLGVPDAAMLKLFLEPFTRQEMQELPNFHAFVRMTTAEGPLPPVVARTLPAKPISSAPRPAKECGSACVLQAA